MQAFKVPKKKKIKKKIKKISRLEVFTHLRRDT